MIDPYQEIFEKIIELSNESGYATFDYLPDESQAYPFVYVGYQQNIDRITKNRFLGKTHIQLDVYGRIGLPFFITIGNLLILPLDNIFCTNIAHFLVLKPKIPTNYTQVYDEISTNKQFISDILQK